jgi:hypothetical protein
MPWLGRPGPFRHEQDELTWLTGQSRVAALSERGFSGIIDLYGNRVAAGSPDIPKPTWESLRLDTMGSMC